MYKSKILSTLCIITLISIQVLNLPTLITQKLNPKIPNFIDSDVQSASAASLFSATSQTITTGQNVSGSYLNTRYPDNDYMRVQSTASGLDVTLTFDNVRLWNANQLLITYDGLATNSSTLSYNIEIRDFANSTWRNILPHSSTISGTADNTTSGLILTSNGGYVEVYDGYFSNGSNTPISTPLSNFVNSSKQTQIRFSSNTFTAGQELAIDHINVQPTFNSSFFPSSITNTAGGTITNEYNDVTTDDNTTNLSVAANGSGIDFYLSYTNVALPTTDANTYLLEFSGFRTTITNFSVTLRDFTNSQWDALSGTAITATSDTSFYMSLRPADLTQSMSDYISNGEMRVRISSASTSGSASVDYARLTIGSTTTGSGSYISTITRGTTASGTEASARSIDTTSADAAWTLNSSNTDNSTTTNEGNDCSAATNQCVAGRFVLPVTVPANSTVQATSTVVRFASSNAALDIRWGLRNYSGFQQDVFHGDNIVAQTVFIREQANPGRPLVGADGAAFTLPATGFTPQRYVDTANNSMTIRLYSSGSDTTARTVSIDFVFASIRTLTPLNNTHHRYTPTGGTITTGTGSASNSLYTRADDTFFWTVNNATGVDVYASFTGVTLPTGSNKIIITSVQSFSVASDTFTVELYDFTNTTFRILNPHGTNFTSDGTGATQEYLTFEVFNGYFTNGSDVPTNTPLSNFISSGEMRLRISSSNSPAGNLAWDFAQIQFAIDPSYHAADSTITTGSVSQEYNDTYTDDATTNYVITPASNTVDMYFSFNNVATPPEGFNAVLVQWSGFKSTAGTYDLNLRNFTTSSWTAIKTGINNTADATHYFMSGDLGNLSDYISTSGEMRLQVSSTGNANAVNIDYVEILLGMAPRDSSRLTSNFGAITNGSSVTALANVDTVSSTDELNINNFMTITTANTTSGSKAYDTVSGKELEYDFPWHVNPGTAITGVIFAYRANAGSTSSTIMPSIEDTGGHFRAMGTNSSLHTSVLGLTAIPNAADTQTLAVASQTFRYGWYTDILEDLWDSTDNRKTFRLYTSANTSILEYKLTVDFIFLSYRWIPSESVADPADQLRHGSWWKAGEERKFSF